MRWLLMGYRDDDERVQALETAGHTVDTVAEADGGAWQTAARTQYDGIWMRWAEADHSVRPVVQYRAQRPSTRIIVEIPDDVSPPNPEIGAWVNLGIYDIVGPTTDIQLVIGNPATIADALRWTGLQPVGDGDDAGRGQLKPIEFRTIEKRVAVSARPVLIAVVGTSPGIGTTTRAVAVARHLAGLGHGVALTESAAAPPALGRWEDELPKNITVFARPAPDPIELVRRREWPYVVVDAGAIAEWMEIVDWQADLTILVGPGDRHRFGRWENLAVGAASYTGSPVAGAVVGGRDGAKVVEGLDREAGLTAFVVPESGKKASLAMQNLLAPVLPDFRARRRWWAESSKPAPRQRDDWHDAPYRAAPVAPVYAPPPLPSKRRGAGFGGFMSLFRLSIDLILIWAIVSILAFILASMPASGPFGSVSSRWIAWAQWIVVFDGHILSRL